MLQKNKEKTQHSGINTKLESTSNHGLEKPEENIL